MTSRMTENLLKVIFFVLIITVFLLQSLFSKAQSLPTKSFDGQATLQAGKDAHQPGQLVFLTLKNTKP